MTVISFIDERTDGRNTVIEKKKDNCRPAHLLTLNRPSVDKYKNMWWSYSSELIHMLKVGAQLKKEKKRQDIEFELLEHECSFIILESRDEWSTSKMYKNLESSRANDSRIWLTTESFSGSSK
jgi:hypothetical protein